MLWVSVGLYLLRGLTSDEVLFMPVTGLVVGLAFACSAILVKRRAHELSESDGLTAMQHEVSGGDAG